MRFERKLIISSAIIAIFEFELSIMHTDYLLASNNTNIALCLKGTKGTLIKQTNLKYLVEFFVESEV